MVLIQAKGKEVLLGTNNTSAKSTEQPEMKVIFDYDFSMGIHEVSCGEYLKHTKETSLKCNNDSLPIVDVTYYDAILYANARSLAEKLDTAYSYTSASFDTDGHCVNLDGFAFHPEAYAFRLPTEAEWVFTAKQNWNPSQGWNADNSDYKAHKICSGQTSSSGICDMAGNVMEWVNDWLGSFRDTSIVNYLGSPDGGSQGERVVKGGSFRNSITATNLYSRGDVYKITSSSKAEYVGFRLAIGTIPNGTWLNANGSANKNPVVVLANPETIKKITGTYNSKLVFRKDDSKNLSFIDYSSGTLSVVEIQDTIDAYHPDISPDGNRVAFCTGSEGIKGKSSLYVRDLNESGSNLVKLDVESATIPRWRILDSGDTVIVYVSDAGNNEKDSDFFKTSTWQVSFANGKFGKPQKIFDGSYHGGLSGNFAVSGARLLRVHTNNKDTIWFNGEQACNASLSTDGSKRTAFLDFGSKTGQDFVGEKYDVHERILIADSTGRLIQSIGSPDNYSFDHSEWSLTGASQNTNQNLLVASLANINGAHEKIVLLNIEDSTFTELAKGDELWHPCLWIEHGKQDFHENEIQLDPDSAGVYMVEGADFAHDAMRVKMELFWTHYSEIEYLLVGSSRVENGLIPDSISAGYAINMGHPYNDMNASLYIAENYGINHASKLKAVVVSLDFDLWQVVTEYTENLIRGIPGYEYDANHNFWKEKLPEQFCTLVKESYPASRDAQDIYTVSRGYGKNTATSWGEPIVETDSSWATEFPQKLEQNIKRLRQFIEVAQESKVNVIGVIFPQNPTYKDTGSWGRYGPQRSVAEVILDTLQSFEKRYENFKVLDENNMGDHDYTDDMALNTDHLAFKGAAQITRRLDKLLKK